MEKRITDDLDALLDVLPPHIRRALIDTEDRHELLEVVLDSAKKRALPLVMDGVKFVRAELREDAGVLGAAVLARQALDGIGLRSERPVRPNGKGGEHE